MEQVGLDFEIRLFGNLDIMVGGQPLAKTRTKRERALFAILALRNGCPTDREWLARTLWPDSLLQQSRSNLRRSLSNLCGALGSFADRLTARSGEVSFDFSKAHVDVVEFDEAVLHRKPHSLRRAILLHRAPLLASFDEDWARGERASRLANYLAIVETLVMWTDSRESRALLEAALQQDPMNERILRKLVETLAESGSTAAAVQTYSAWAEKLDRLYGGSPSPETVNLVSCLRSKPRVHSPVTGPVFVPDYGTKFFGRESEIFQLTLALTESQGVALTGLPGVGKTRLAVELARGLSQDYSDGVYFIESGRGTFQSFLENCRLALDVGTMPSPEALGSFMRRRNLLLVIDDVDFDLAEISRFLATLTGSLSRCRVLATSRRPLNLPGAQLFHLSPLDSINTGPEMFSSAANLFENRARLVDPDFTLTSLNASSVEAICRKLDRIPLAIEIAAAWIESLPLSTIEGRLGVRLARETFAFDLHANREKTLNAAFEECLERLSSNELRVLQTAAPFEDGWTLNSAVDVSELSETDVAFALGGLVQKSLVTFQRGSDRYRMLDTTREIVTAGLGVVEWEICVEGLSRHYRDLLLALDLTPDRYFEDLPDDRLLRERRNFELCLAWWQAHDPYEAVRLQFLLLHWRILPMEDSGWHERLTLGEAPPPGLGPMVYSCIGFSSFWARRRGTFDLLIRAVSSAAAAGEPQWEAHAQNALSLYHQRNGRFREAAECERAGELAARRANMPFFAELSYSSNSVLSWRQGAPGSLESLRRQLTRGEVTGDWRARYAALRALCCVAMETSEFENASSFVEELVPLAREHCRHELANILLWCAQIDRKRGHSNRVPKWLDEAILVSRERRAQDREADALQEYSQLSEDSGDLAGAETYLVSACRIFESRNSARPLVDLLVRRAELAIVANSPSKARNVLEMALGLAEEEGLEWRENDTERITMLKQKLGLSTDDKIVAKQ